MSGEKKEDNLRQVSIETVHSEYDDDGGWSVEPVKTKSRVKGFHPNSERKITELIEKVKQKESKVKVATKLQSQFRKKKARLQAAKKKWMSAENMADVTQFLKEFDDCLALNAQLEEEIRQITGKGKQKAKKKKQTKRKQKASKKIKKRKKSKKSKKANKKIN